ncbi:peptide deformylase [Pseudothermotoga sp.]|uniref:peptide deformylase n=1 Tax=Pseudothermotoga sp. TaxID=2033661 RepID=UPI002998C894|nr:peptide deformylase [Pseudothermotoga sp.]MCX7812037.1 peptide deformylase [Pseudothermotoga sp.]MDW8139107.1 peptide deformylase [Pseudothermotoga sp.]
MRKIRLLGDPVLRKKAKEVSQIDEYVLNLVKEMFEVMYANDGIGLAAPQLGVSLRIIVMDDGKPRVMINPQIVYKSEEKIVGEEGCLSVPEIFENVERSKEVIVKYRDENNVEREEKFVDYSARIVQHEYDHLDGILFVDLIPAERRAAIREKLLDIVKRSVHQR